MSDTDILTQNTIPHTMRAIVLEKPNDQINLADIELPVPECSDNELLIKVEYVGLNPVDGHFCKIRFLSVAVPAYFGA